MYPLPVPVPGTRRGFEWASGPDGGLLCVPNDKLPRSYPIDGGTGSDKGYLATANADPLGVSADNDPYSNNPGGVPYLSFEWDDQGYRVARIQEVLDAQAGQRRQGDAGRHAGAAGRPRDDRGPALPGVPVRALPGRTDSRRRRLRRRRRPSSSPGALAIRWRRSSLDCPTGLAAGSLDPATALNDPDPTNSANSEGLPGVPHLPAAGARGDLQPTRRPWPGWAARPGNEVRALITLLSGAQGAVPNPNNVFCRDVAMRVEAGTAAQQQDLPDAGARRARLRLRAAEGRLRRREQLAVGPRAHRHLPLHRARIPADRPGASGPDPTHVPAAPGRWTSALRPAGARPSSPSPYGSGGNVRWLAAMDGTADHTFMQLPGVENGGPYPFGQSTMLTDWVRTSTSTSRSTRPT